jgi:hypothetical protein
VAPTIVHNNEEHFTALVTGYRVNRTNCYFRIPHENIESYMNYSTSAGEEGVFLISSGY